MRALSALKKWSKRVLLSLLVLVILLIIIVYCLLATDWGFRYALDFSRSYWPNSLTLNKVEGNLADGLRVEELGYQDDAITLAIASAALDLSLSQLLSQRLIIKKIEATGLVLTISPTPPSTEPGPAFEGITAPIDIIVKKASINQATISASGQRAIVDSLDTKASWIGDKLTIDQLDFAGASIGQADRNSLSVVDAVLAKGSAELDGELSTNAELGLLLNYQYDLSLNLPIKTVDGKGSIEGDIRKLWLNNQSNLLAKAGNSIADSPSTIKTEATVNIEQSAIDLSTTINGEQVLLLDQQWLALTDLQLTVNGPFDRLALLSKGKISSSILANRLANRLIPDSTIVLESVLEPEQWQIDTLDIKSQAGDISTRGRVVFDTLKIVQNAQLKKFNPGFWDKSLEGSLSGSVLADLSLADGVLINQLKTNITGSIAKQKFQSNIDINGSDERLIIDNATVSQGPNTLTAKGRLVLSTENISNTAGDLVIKLTAPELSKLHPSLGGAITLDANLKRQGKNLNFQTSGNGKKIIVNDNKIGELDLRAKGSVDPQKWQTAKGKITLEAQQLNLAGQLFQTTTAVLEGSSASHQLSLNIDGEQLSTELKLNGELDDKQWQAVINSHRLVTEFDVGDNKQQYLWQLDKPTSVTLGLANNTLMLSDACWLESNSSANLCIDINQQKPDDLQASLTLKQLPTNSLAPWLPAQLMTEGYLTGQAQWQAKSQQLTGELEWLDGRIRVDQAEPPYQADVDQAKLSVRFKQSVLQSSVVLNLSDQTTLTGVMALSDIDTADMSRARITTGELDINIPNTDYLASLSPEISAIEGQVAIKVNASGRLQTPIIEGKANLGENGELVLTRTNTVIGKPNVTITPKGEQLVLNGQATLGAGTLNLEGLVDLNKARYTIDVTGEQLELIDTEELQIVANADIDVVIDNGAITLTGALDVPKAKIIIDSLPPSAITPSNDIVIVNQDVEEQTHNDSLGINLKVTLGDEVFFSALGLESNLKGSLKLEQTPRKSLFARGQIDLINGQYLFYGQKLTIEEGKLYFAGPIDNPRIVVRAVREAKSVTAGVRLEGTPGELESSLYSEPSLPEAEILSYIITGKPLSGGGGSEDELAQAAILLGLKQTTGLLGSDDISIDSSDGTGNSALTTGKQISDRLYLGYRYGIFSRTGAWLLKYTLTESLQLESAYGENQTIDLIYEIKKP